MHDAITDSIERPRTRPRCRTKLYILADSSRTTDGRSRKDATLRSSDIASLRFLSIEVETLSCHFFSLRYFLVC